MQYIPIYGWFWMYGDHEGFLDMTNEECNWINLYHFVWVSVILTFILKVVEVIYDAGFIV